MSKFYTLQMLLAQIGCEQTFHQRLTLAETGYLAGEYELWISDRDNDVVCCLRGERYEPAIRLDADEFIELAADVKTPEELEAAIGAAVAIRAAILQEKGVHVEE